MPCSTSSLSLKALFSTIMSIIEQLPQVQPTQTPFTGPRPLKTTDHAALSSAEYLLQTEPFQNQFVAFASAEETKNAYDRARLLCEHYRTLIPAPDKDLHLLKANHQVSPSTTSKTSPRASGPSTPKTSTSARPPPRC